MTQAPLRARIAEVLDRLTPSERRVAEFVVADPGAVPGATVASLARAASVSEPTVIRFCRAIGLDGFAELRLEMVRAEAAPPPPLPRHIVPGMAASEAPAVVLDSAVAALEGMRRTLDADAVSRAALALLRAARVEIWACGANVAAARHLEEALVGLCRAVVMRADGAAQAAVAATLESEAVAVCFSRSGADRDVLEAARAAAASGATVLAITRPRTPLAAVSALPIACDAAEGAVPGNPATILQVATVEAIAAAAVLLAPPGAAARMQRAAAARRARRVEH